MSSFDIGLSIALGIGLAAATGFRVFLPLLVASVAAHTGHLHLGESFSWLDSVLTGGLTNPVVSTAELGGTLRFRACVDCTSLGSGGGRVDLLARPPNDSQIAAIRSFIVIVRTAHGSEHRLT
jgi:hypothetical protein